MAGSYAYFENDTAIIGNDYIERRFSTKDNRLVTTEIVNKRIKGNKSVKFRKFSAEFFIGFKRKKMFGSTTDFLSSNELTVDNVNVFKRRVEFVFKPYTYNGARITFIVNVEIEDDNHYMTKYIEMIVDPDRQHLVTVDYIDGEHISVDTPEQLWTIGDIEPAYLSKYHSALGQPVYANGLFFGCEFPLAENNYKDNTIYCRYFSGKRFDRMRLNCGQTFKTWKTVVGAARDIKFEVIREDFLSYIRNISRDIKPRFQYNSWYDHMHDITNENISKSFMEIEKNLSKTMVPPLDSYVVDDGFVDWSADFWCFNKKFPEELYPASTLAKKFSSEFGLWNGPRGGYTNNTPKFGKQMEKAGTGGYNKAAKDVCVSSLTYIKNITDYYLECDRKFDINYWKLDGFLLKPCPSKKHGHMTGGYNEMYQYTEMWENWIDIFRKLRITRESAGKDLWINQTSYCNASPWFLQWSESLWIQNSGDIGFVDKTPTGTSLGKKDVDKVLTYRDGRYYDFSVARDYQFPHEYIYNHDPIYGNTAKISMTDEEYRVYMFVLATRGTAFWELYYSYNMFNEAKWRINADALRFVRNEYDILKKSQFIGGKPEKGNVYGYSCQTPGAGIVSLRNPACKPQQFVLKLDEVIGVTEASKNMKMAKILPFEQANDAVYSYGDQITFDLDPHETVIVKFSAVEEKMPSLVYGRFENDKELILFFDDRLHFNAESVTANAKISKARLLEDYSTVKITFEEPVENADVALEISNSFGDLQKIGYSCKYYPNNICDCAILPFTRDFSIEFVSNAEKDCTLLECGDILSVGCEGGYYSLQFGDKISKGDAAVNAGDRLTVVCEPNGLMKLYVNSLLSCSVYNEKYCEHLLNGNIVLKDSANEIKIISKALSYDEV